MEQKYTYTMDKHMQSKYIKNGRFNIVKNSKGFTLIETMIVVSFIATLIMIIPSCNILEKMNALEAMEQIHQFLLRQQQYAIFHKKFIEIKFDNNSISSNNETMNLLNAEISGKNFSFTPKGTVTKAQTIICFCGKEQRKIIVELGSGTIVKK